MTASTSTHTYTLPHAGHDHILEVRGLRFRVRESGEPAGPPLVLLHGIMGHAREWDAMVEVLAPTFRILAVDQRGHGETSWADPDGYTAAAMAEDTVALLEALDIGGAHVVGHSMGAMAAMVLAAERPALVERLVLIDVGPASIADAAVADELAGFLAHLGESSYATPDEAFALWQAGDPLAQPSHLRHYVEHCLVRREDGRYVWRFDGRGLVTFPRRGTCTEDLWAAVDRISAPTLLLRGEHSPFLSPTHAREVVGRLRDAELVEIPGGGHDLGVQQPVAVGEAILRFLTGDAAAAPSAGR
jgi:pimeloyl-ACP methyl ester carboxylesterase